MQTLPQLSTPQTFGKLLTRAITLYPTHRAILLRTAAIFYLPAAALSFLFAENLATSFLLSLVLWPVDGIVNLSLIIHCSDALTRASSCRQPSGQAWPAPPARLYGPFRGRLGCDQRL